MADHPDYYAILEVSPDRYHPDVAGTGDLARMQQLNAAYQVLGDREQRLLYDLSRGVGQRGAHRSAAPAWSSDSAASAPHTAGGRPHSSSHAERPRVATVRASAGPLRRAGGVAAPDAVTVTAVAFARSGTCLGAGLIDGRVLVGDLASGRSLQMLAPGRTSAAGVLQELRLSPSGALAVAWGLLLGMRVWRVDTAQSLWATNVNGPVGSLDATLYDAPAQVRLALPDAPLALADDDPFRWAHEGRYGSAIFTRPLAGPVDASWAVARRCLEVGGAVDGRPPASSGWRVHQRLLAADGQRLLTFSTDATGGKARTGALHVWDLDHRPLLGGARPRQLLRVSCPPSVTWYPLVATPDLAWVGISYLERAMRLVAPATRAERTVVTGPLPSDARAALSPTGDLLAVARSTRLDLWRTADGAPLQQWEFAAEITALTFAADAARPVLGVGVSTGLAEVWA